VSWAVGLILGPFCGGAFAQNVHATWRWVSKEAFPMILMIQLADRDYSGHVHQHPGCRAWRASSDFPPARQEA
jgi:hypothetical protein